MPVDVMAIGAHPDDVEIGMGATIAKLSKDGYKIVLVDLSNGEPTPYGTAEKRHKESMCSAKCLGVHKRITLDITNREIFDTVDNRKKLASIIREYKPKVLFVPFDDDAHPDHVEACKLGFSSRFYAKLSNTDMPFEPHYPARIYQFYTLHLRLKITPSFVFNVSKDIEKKMEALRCYNSQFSDNPNNRGVFESVITEAKYWGKQIRREYGEPFYSKEQIEVCGFTQLLHE